METDIICSRCRQDLVLMTSAETQTDDFAETESAIKNEIEISSNDRFAIDSGSQSIEQCISDVAEEIQVDQSIGSDFGEIPGYAVFQNVVDEALDVDPSMELGTAAEMSNPDNEIVVLTRSFEAPSNPKMRWKKAVNTNKAVNRLYSKKRRNVDENEMLDEGLPLSDKEDEILFGGVRRIVISNGRLNVRQHDSNGVASFPETNDSVNADDSSVLREVKEEASITENNGDLHDDLHDVSAEPGRASELKKFAEISEDKEKLRRASSVLGPNKKCLQVQEEHENIEPEKDLGLLNSNNEAFDVVVLTRSFETTPAADEGSAAHQRWNNLKNATRFSKAVNRMRSIRQQRDENMALYASDQNDQIVIGSGYRKVSMKTVDEIVKISTTKNRFWRRRSRFSLT
eukprot:gene6035-11409_t